MRGTVISPSSTSSVMLLAILLIASCSVGISAKRGCSAFGHSCYGGHGKRSSYPEASELDLVRGSKEEVPMEYDPNRPIGDTVALEPPSMTHEYNVHSPRPSNPLTDYPRWYLLLRKLLIPPRHQSVAYPPIQK